MPPEPDEITHDRQVTPAHVLAALGQFKAEVNGRFDTLQRDVDTLQRDMKEVKQTASEAGLNGHTPLLKAFLEQYAATYVSRQAWQTVRSDIRHRLRFLAPGKHWLGILLAGALGAIGWQAVASAHLTWPLH